jgi:hypothetical protein
MTLGKFLSGVLLMLAAGAQIGCAWGYVTYFEPDARGARAAPHPDPYLDPAPPSAVELAPASLSVGCSNLRKFVLLPLPWFFRGFRPSELEITLAFSPEPRSVELDLGAVGVTLDGETIWPSHVEYAGNRPPPTYHEIIALPIGGRVRLEAPTLLTFSFTAEASDASEFRMSLGEVRMDGARVLVPPLAFSREGRFVVYRSPEKRKRVVREGQDPLDDL